MSDHHSSAILVAGAGPAGLIAALAFGKAGYDVTLAGPPVRKDDARTTALMMPSLGFLEQLGVADAVRTSGAPLRVMRIVDATKRLVRAPTVTFRAGEIDREAFGYNIQNSDLNAILEKAVAGCATVRRVNGLVSAWKTGENAVVATLDTGDEIEARLAIAADGRGSPARAAAGIGSHGSALPQSALVLIFAHDRPHEDTSTELHTESGPFTQVPLPDARRSSLVWVVDPDRAEELTQLSDAELSDVIEETMQSMLGKVRVESSRQVYPLSVVHATGYARNRIALVGEAAHVFPPIGAQGLNLGVRDIRDLLNAAQTDLVDPGSDAVLALYNRSRRPDVLMRSGAVNALNRSLLTDFLPAQFARSVGLGLLGSFAPLRSFFMREGMEPGSGFAAVNPDAKGRDRVAADLR